VIEMPLIPPGKPPLLSAIGTERGRRKIVLFPSDHRRNFFVEGEITLGDLEGGRTVATRMCHLMDSGKVTFLAIHRFQSLRAVRRLNRLPTLHTHSIPECTGIPESHTVFVPLIEAASGERNPHRAIEAKFLRENFERTLGDFTRQNFLGDIISNILNAIGNLDEWPQILPLLFIFLLPFPTPLLYCFFGEREVFLRNSFIVGITGNRCGEEFAPLPCLPLVASRRGAKWGFLHMFNDFGDEHLILLLRILLVQNAVLLMPETHAAEAIFAAVEAVAAIEQIGNIRPAGFREAHLVKIDAAEMIVVPQLAIETPCIAVEAVFAPVEPCAILTIFQIRAIERVMCIFGE